MSLARFFARPTRGDLDAYRDRRLRQLLSHAHARVPYYRRLFDQHGVDVSGIRGVEDLVRLPLTSRSTLQELSRDELVADDVDPERLVERWSSGSSGRKIAVRRTWLEDRTVAALRKRAERAVGVRVRDRQVRFELMRGTPPNDGQRLIKLARALGCFRLECLDAMAEPARLIRELCDIRPDLVSGFSSVVMRVAEEAGDGGLRELGVRAVITGGEVLTLPMRRKIASAFDARVIDKYGAIEFDMLAIECPSTGHMHVCDDGVVLEILRDGKPAAPGESGEVVVTGLQSFAMPLIRYRIGDVATRGEDRCPCGAPFSTVEAVRGRVLDYFVLPDGRQVHPLGVTTRMLASHEWIRVYQLTQERPDYLVLRAVASERPSADRLTELRAGFAVGFGSDVTLDVRLVDELAVEPSGKFRVSRSLVRSHYDEVD